MTDYRIRGFVPADEQTAVVMNHLELFEDLFHVMAAHHTANGLESYLVMHDSAATQGFLGAPPFVSLHLIRNAEDRSFRAEDALQPSVHFARLWLVNRGCAPEAIELRLGEYFMPAGPATRQAVERIVRSGNRYEVLDHYAHVSVPEETWVIARDTDPASSHLPVRLFLEQIHPRDPVYTIREGAFQDMDAARRWLLHRDTPLPKPGRKPAAATRGQAALARSANASPVAPTSGPRQPSAAPSTDQQAARRRTP